MRLPLNELRWLKRAALDSNRPLEHLIQRRINREPLHDDVAKFEDPTALIGGCDGLEFYRVIAGLIARDGFLSPKAVVALEVGHSQAAAVCDILSPTGFKTSIWMDSWGKKRTIIAQRQ
ncbi:hypothetical protein HHX47_DHR3000596 [Lentinula edodes]|nr:hypothetical protein HHX47_DHR3000596 [Lentinula edodes]